MEICAFPGCRNHARGLVENLAGHIPATVVERVPAEFCRRHGLDVLIFCNWLAGPLPNGRSFDGDRARFEFERRAEA